MMNPKQPTSETAWIDEMTDSQCMEVFWLYVEDPDEFLSAYPPGLLGNAMRYALHQVADDPSAPPRPR